MIAIVLLIALPVLWVVTSALFTAVGRVPLQRPARSLPDDLGPEAPAVANLLTHSCMVTPDAMPATVLDLAARDVIELEEVAPGRILCRIPRRRRDVTGRHEQRILEFLESRARHGVVPAEALTTGFDEESSEWSGRFAADVFADARDQGLVESLWSSAFTFTFLATTAAFITAYLVTWAAAANDLEASAAVPIVLVTLLAIMTWLGIMDIVTTQRRSRPTRRGREAAARWLAVERWLSGDEHLASYPPPAVAVWDRYLAYAAALGLGDAACRGLPMGTDPTASAWSNATGNWRRLDLRYPRWWPTAWGRRPLNALWLALLSGLVATLAFTIALRRGTSYVDVVLSAVGVVGAAWAVVTGVRAVRDLRGTRTVTGVVIRRWVRHGHTWNPWGALTPRRHYVVI